MIPIIAATISSSPLAFAAAIRKTNINGASRSSYGTLWKYHGTISSFFGRLPDTHMRVTKETIITKNNSIPIK